MSRPRATVSGAERGDSGRNPSSTIVWGLIGALVSELCSVGLLAASGWFITASAIAGMTAGSTFSYIFPSGWVRAFAIGRIAFQYVQRLLLHKGALSRVGDAREEFFARAASAPGIDTVRDGALLDRAVHDTDTVGMRLISVTAPLWSFGGVSVASIVTALVVSPASAIPIAVFSGVAPLSAWWIDVRARTSATTADLARRRVQARSALVEMVDAWPELASLGAAGVVRSDVVGRLDGYGRSRRSSRGLFGLGELVIGCLGVLAMCGATAMSVAVDHVSAPTAILILLMVAGLSTPALTLPAAMAQRRAVNEAGERLQTASLGASSRRDVPLDLTVSETELTIRDYEVPVTATSAGALISVSLGQGGALALVGRSGSGKTTMLDALARELERHEGGVGRSLEVPVDDYLFTGTVAENLRLGAPRASDEQLRKVLDALGLTDVALRDPVGVGGRALSGGEQTRLRIARGVLVGAGTLMVDEPLAGLDEVIARRTLEVLGDSERDGFLVLAVHDGRLVTRVLGDRVESVILGDARP